MEHMEKEAEQVGIAPGSRAEAAEISVRNLYSLHNYTDTKEIYPNIHT